VEHDLPAGRAETDIPEAGADVSTNGDADLAPEEIDIALDAIEHELADVELALQRLGDGTYGRCETCGGALTDDELEALPAGRFCHAHLPLGRP